MNCDQAAALLTGEVDGELDRLRSHALRKHTAGCTACAARLDALQDTRRRLRAELPYHKAPEALRARLAAQHAAPALLPPSARNPRPAAGRWRWFGGGLLTGGLAAATLWLASSWWLQAGFGQDLPTQLVGLHTRATLGNQLIEVASSDRHTVKPWLSARLDYAIPVTDWSAAGFALMGGRVDRLEGRAVAVLVYRHRDHVIDVFVRPAAAGGGAASGAASGRAVVRGFNVAAAQGSEMEWLAASDLNAADLSAFVQGLASGKVTAASE